jgi:hypothetical protein
MNSQFTLLARTALIIAIALLSIPGCTKKSNAQASSVDLQLDVKTPFRFVAYGDTRFHDPKDTEAANPSVRVALVQAIANANPAFVCFTGDIVYNGYDTDDWKVWDTETSIWREEASHLPSPWQPRPAREGKSCSRQLFSALPRLKEQPLLFGPGCEHTRSRAGQFAGGNFRTTGPVAG